MVGGGGLVVETLRGSDDGGYWVVVESNVVLGSGGGGGLAVGNLRGSDDGG